MQARLRRVKQKLLGESSVLDEPDSCEADSAPPEEPNVQLDVVRTERGITREWDAGKGPGGPASIVAAVGSAAGMAGTGGSAGMTGTVSMAGTVGMAGTGYPAGTVSMAGTRGKGSLEPSSKRSRPGLGFGGQDVGSAEGRGADEVRTPSLHGRYALDEECVDDRALLRAEQREADRIQQERLDRNPDFAPPSAHLDSSSILQNKHKSRRT